MIGRIVAGFVFALLVVAGGYLCLVGGGAMFLGTLFAVLSVIEGHDVSGLSGGAWNFYSSCGTLLGVGLLMLYLARAIAK